MFKIKNDELIKNAVGEVLSFPKYTTQLINLANQNAQGTRPRVVGQMSDLIQEFPYQTYEEWVEWYQQQMPEGIEHAADKIYGMVLQLQQAIQLIDKEMVQEWVKDLVMTKTYVGLRFQDSILKRIGEMKGEPYRLAKPEEESRGIDGYIGDVPVSIKPLSYKTKDMLRENIDVAMIYYEKVKDGIKVSTDL